MTRLSKKILLRGKIHLKTGLHIGAGKERVKIGGLDNPVVRALLRDGEPYIPGSSLKGKIRSLIEQAYGYDCMGQRNDPRHENGSCKVCQVFGGVLANQANHASRVIFRDAYMTAESKRRLEILDTPLPYTEVKAETAIDRITGRARSGTLRQTERVPAGTEFEFEVMVNVFKGEHEPSEPSEEELREMLCEGISLLNKDYLGASGSRGYGQVAVWFEECQAWTISSQNGKVDIKGDDETKSKWEKELQNKGLWGRPSELIADRESKEQGSKPQ